MFPLEPLTAATGLTPRKLMARLGWSGSRLSRHRSSGLTETEADRTAIRLGLHPSELWPEWWSKVC